MGKPPIKKIDDRSVIARIIITPLCHTVCRMPAILTCNIIKMMADVENI